MALASRRQFLKNRIANIMTIMIMNYDMAKITYIAEPYSYVLFVLYVDCNYST